MAVTSLPIATIPKIGMSLTYTEHDSSLWEEKLEETLLQCTFVRPIEAELSLQVEDENVLVSGSFSARITVPCSLCLEPATFDVGHIFYDCIQIKENALEEEGNYIHETKKGFEIDVAAIVFEEFLIDASISVLCREHCLGLCSRCGINKNLESCSCDENKKDPRLEKLHTLVLEKKN